MGRGASGRRGIWGVGREGSVTATPRSEGWYHLRKRSPRGYHGRQGGRAMEETLNLADHYLKDVAVEFRKLKTLADKAIAQVEDGDLTTVLDPESNSIAMLMQHLGGNL